MDGFWWGMVVGGFFWFPFGVIFMGAFQAAAAADREQEAIEKLLRDQAQHDELNWR